jgi:hypothetical protein
MELEGRHLALILEIGFSLLGITPLFGLRNFCRQNATFSWKQYVHFAYWLLAYKANYLIHEAIYLTHEANYLTHEANYLTHEANYLNHEANYLTHEANAIIFST